MVAMVDTCIRLRAGISCPSVECCSVGRNRQKRCRSLSYEQRQSGMVPFAVESIGGCAGGGVGAVAGKASDSEFSGEARNATTRSAREQKQKLETRRLTN